MIDDYTIIGVKDQLLYADILRHIRKHTIYWLQGHDVYKYESDYNHANPKSALKRPNSDTVKPWMTYSCLASPTETGGSVTRFAAGLCKL
jgi:hypothetical protein